MNERRNFVGSGNDPFVCRRCGLEVLPLSRGSFRNHCPGCLWSRHVDIVPGDRRARCRGLMEPVALRGTSAGDWVLIHRCVECGKEQHNRVALDDPRQPDSWDRLMEVSQSSGA